MSFSSAPRLWRASSALPPGRSAGRYLIRGAWFGSTLRAFVATALVACGLCSSVFALNEQQWTVPGLEESAEILVDRWGVPHLYAQSQDDLFFLQGFNAARDRLWQLDLWRRRGEGKLSEVFGATFVKQDRAARLFLFRGDMHAEWLAYASDTKRIVTAFVDGVNAFIVLTEQQPELLPPEFDLLDYRPAPWTPETVVKIRSHGLLRNATSELERGVLLHRFGRGTVDLRDHLEPAHDLQVPEGLDLALLSPQILDVYRLGTRGVRFDDLLLPARAELLAEVEEGSNNWAVSATRTATGRPILADDPHRRQAVPSLRYIVHLDAPGLQAIGAGEPALPGVSIGHNGRIAFGLTIFSIDQEDLYVYDTLADDPLQYAYQDRWERMRVSREVIGVRDASDVEVELRFTRHGPVVYEDREAGVAFALRAAWLEPGMAPYLGSIEYMRARNWDQFLAAMNRWGSPSENQVYADVEGNIGWKPGGLAPIRPNWDGLLPVPGSGAYEWAGFLDMEQLPVEYNPPRGWVATANHMNLPPNYPLQLGWEWRAPFRFGRIAEVLEESSALSIEDSLRLQADYVSLPARRLVRVVADLEMGDGESVAAQRLLDDWNAELNVDSAAAALFEVWFHCCLRPAVVEEIAVHSEALSAEAAVALGGLHTHHLLALMEAPDSRLGPQPVETRDRLLRETLSAAFAETETLQGSDPGAWRWGDLHQIELRHPLSEHMPDDLRELANVGPHSRGGSGDTPGNTGYRYPEFRQVSGASFRVVLDVGEWDNSVAMNNPGQSGDPRSRHYDDLFEAWASDRAFPLLWTREKIEAAAETLLTLLPPAD